MKVLVTGSGKGGSWEIRGRQLGEAIGATVDPAAKVDGFDLVVLVKRHKNGAVEAAHKAGIPLVYDMVDAWPQPAGNGWSRIECLDWLDGHIRAIAPAAIVASTKTMAEDCDGFGVPVLYLPHHARPGLKMNPIRPEVRTVVYQGGPHYLGKWRDFLHRECASRGWAFRADETKTATFELADADIAVAVREQAGYAATQWKSNVKLANAQGSGTPVICGHEAGYFETASGAEMWVNSEHLMRCALDTLADHEVRKLVSVKLQAAAPKLEDVARRYKEWLRAIA